MKFKNNLDLNYCQGYMALQYHYEEACNELQITPSPKYAIFSRKYNDEIKSLNKDMFIINSLFNCLL